MTGLLKLVKRRDITIYLTPWCWPANKAKYLLREWGLPFQEVDISQDEAAARQVEAWNNGFRSVPTLVLRLLLTEPTPQGLAAALGVAS